jgi:hypothetical protein
MSSKLKGSAHTWIGAALVTVALVVAGCGSSPPASGSKAPATTTSSSSTGSSSSASGGASAGGSSSNGIPQGANAGDADADNHGGPSDGDGNL